MNETSDGIEEPFRGLVDSYFEDPPLYEKIFYEKEQKGIKRKDAEIENIRNALNKGLDTIGASFQEIKNRYSNLPFHKRFYYRRIIGKLKEDDNYAIIKYYGSILKIRDMIENETCIKEEVFRLIKLNNKISAFMSHYRYFDDKTFSMLFIGPDSADVDPTIVDYIDEGRFM